MAIEKGKLQLEKRAVSDFKRLWNNKKFEGQRLGQAFCAHFRLERLADQYQLRGLYEADGAEAEKIIAAVFHLN